MVSGKWDVELLANILTVFVHFEDLMLLRTFEIGRSRLEISVNLQEFHLWNILQRPGRNLKTLCVWTGGSFWIYCGLFQVTAVFYLRKGVEISNYFYKL